MYSGPHVKRDGLVFGYDTGQFATTNPNFSKFKPVKGNNRFFKGKASVNYIAFQNPRIDSSYSSYTVGTGTWDSRHPDAIIVYSKNGSNLTSYVNTGVGDWSNTDHAHWQLDPILKKPVVVMHDRTGSWKAKSFGTAMPSWSSLGLTHGSKYTISWLQWTDNLAKNAKAGLYSKTTAGANGFHDGQANSSTSYNTELGTWQRVYQTYITSNVRDLNSTYLSIYMYGHYNVRATVKIADVQLEIYDHPTAYQEFDGSATYTQTRSSTQSLIDLTKTTNIDVSSVTFDSDGLPTFDGANDRIAITDASKFYSNVWTWEFVIKFNSNSGTYQGIVWGEGATGGGSGYQYLLTLYNYTYFHYRIYNTTTQWANTNVNINFTPTEYNHIVWQFDNGTTKIYINGELLHTDISRGLYSGGTTSPLYIGSRNDLVYNFNGNLPVAKHYNKTLTAQEIKQNFKAYKNRFNL